VGQDGAGLATGQAFYPRPPGSIPGRSSLNYFGFLPLDFAATRSKSKCGRWRRIQQQLDRLVERQRSSALPSLPFDSSILK